MTHICKKEDKIDAVYNDLQVMKGDIKKLLQRTSKNEVRSSIFSVFFGTLGGAIVATIMFLKAKGI